jgi:hypothetical protein
MVKVMEFKQMGLKQCAQFDFQNKLREKLTGWGAVSAMRAAKKISRSFRINQGKGKRGGK